MFDKKELSRKVWYRLVGHWTCTAPVVASALAAGTGIVSQNGAPFLFGSAVAFLIGIGAVVIRKAYVFDSIIEDETTKAKASFEEERNKIANKRERELDAFRDKLASDGDSRDEHLLDDLRSIANAFRSDRTWVENVPEMLSANVLARLDTMFEASIASLDRSYKLRITARTVRGEGKQELLKASGQLLDSVQTSIDELGKILAGVTKLSIKRLTGATLEDSELSNNMRELRTILDSAERAESTRQQLLASDEDDRYKEYAEVKSS